ncbi:rhomboid family intramembrane serine protease [Roseovarius albus]|nr:rhomboid family intramembrane serine protease [Roseovarius albus]
MSRIPFTLLFLTIMVVANAFAGTLSGAISDSALSGWGISHLSIRQGELYRLLTGTFLSHDFGMFLRQMVFAATVIGMFEWTAGTRRTFAMFLSIDVIGTLLVLFVILPILVQVHPSINAEALSIYDVGMSAGGFGLIGALVAQWKHRWIYLIAIYLAIFAKVWISFDIIADTAHILCLFLGFALQTAISGYATRR